MKDIGEEVKANKKFNEKHNPFVESKNFVRKTGTSGITLVALVVTITILVILAGVSIATLTGDKGILKKAETASNTTKKEELKERVRTDILEYQNQSKIGDITTEQLKDILDKYFEGVPEKVEDLEKNMESPDYSLKAKDEYGKDIELKVSDLYERDLTTGTTTPPPTAEELKPGDTATTAQKDNYEDENGKTATIPEGFKVSEVTDEQNIDTGLVVIAPDGSEFVWVPVPYAIATGENTAEDEQGNKAMAVKVGEGYRGILYTFNGTGSTVKSGCTTTDSDFREPATLEYSDSSTNVSDSEREIKLENLQSEYKEMIESVDEYGGFYVGRYETSYENGKVQSISEKTPMNSKDDNGQMWYGLYDKQKKYASSVTFGNGNLSTVVGSSMVWGSQYDAMMNWMIKGSDRTKVGRVFASHDKTKTGSTTDDIINNIYDLGGNLLEWTLEASGYFYRFGHGGFGFNNTPPSYRTGDTPTSTSTWYGSRLTLYIK